VAPNEEEPKKVKPENGSHRIREPKVKWEEGPHNLRISTSITPPKVMEVNALLKEVGF